MDFFDSSSLVALKIQMSFFFENCYTTIVGSIPSKDIALPQAETRSSSWETLMHICSDNGPWKLGVLSSVVESSFLMVDPPKSVAFHTFTVTGYKYVPKYA